VGWVPDNSYIDDGEMFAAREVLLLLLPRHTTADLMLLRLP
jgi:hypothetical protein